MGRSAPPDSTSLISGSRLTWAISSARRFFLSVHGFIEPPRTVGSWAMITHSTPDTTPMPVTMHGAHVELGAPRRERRELEEGRVAVDEQLDALACEQLAAGAVAGLVALAAARDRERDLLVVLGDELEQRRAVGLIGLARRIDRGAEDGHRYLRRTCEQLA